MLSLLIFAAHSWAADPTVAISFSDDLEFRFYQDEAPYKYVEQVNRLNTSATSNALTLQLQVDEVVLFANQYTQAGTLYTERVLVDPDLFSPLPGFAYANVEKIRLRLEQDDYSLSLGDVYAAFGRGLALNVNRNVDIDIDSSIQGAKMVYRPGPWDIIVVAGQLNRQQVLQYNPNGPIYGDRRHAVGGARVERFGLGPANLGAHVVAYDFVRDTGWIPGFEELGTAIDTLTAGLTLEFFGVAGADWYLEGDVFTFPSGEFPAVLDGEYDGPGHALYGSTSFYPGKFVFLIEGKKYLSTERVNTGLTFGNEQYEVVAGPTLEYERAINLGSSKALNSNDIYGGRLRVDWAAIPAELTPYLALAVSRDLEYHDSESAETIVHAVSGVEILGHTSAIINSGYRVDKRDRVALGADKQCHADAGVVFPIAGAFHGDIALDAQRLIRGVDKIQAPDFTTISSGVGVATGTASLTWFTDFTDQPESGVGNLGEHVFGAAELQIKTSSHLTLKAFGGAYKAGIRCAGGQCRVLPGFAGGRVSAQTQF
ncbi:MAG: hypothetical protein GWP91_23840 [Rhodobacterales bacterium]|nr:hypothetical protein [Rhodobacterales bacterium]